MRKEGRKKDKMMKRERRRKRKRERMRDVGEGVRDEVNFTNIIRAAFAPIFFRQKSTNLKCKYKKAAGKTFVL